MNHQIRLPMKMKGFAEQGWLNIAGGCCGTTPAHIAAMAEAMKDILPKIIAGEHPPAVSGIDTVYIEEDNRPYYGWGAYERIWLAKIQTTDS